MGDSLSHLDDLLIRFESLKRQNKFNKVTLTSLLSGG